MSPIVAAMTPVHIEVLVEPFKENDPGRHVMAAVDAMVASGLDADMGPFATTADGDLEAIISATADLLRLSFAAGADSVQVRVDRT